MEKVRKRGIGATHFAVHSAPGSIEYRCRFVTVRRDFAVSVGYLQLPTETIGWCRFIDVLPLPGPNIESVEAGAEVTPLVSGRVKNDFRLNFSSIPLRRTINQVAIIVEFEQIIRGEEGAGAHFKLSRSRVVQIHGAQLADRNRRDQAHNGEQTTHIGERKAPSQKSHRRENSRFFFDRRKENLEPDQ